MGEDPFLRGNPPAANLGLLASGPGTGIFETLTALTPGFGLAPGLAVRWEASSPTVWRFHLRRGVRFHDGQTLDAAAIASALEPVTRRQTRPRGLDPGSIRAVSGDEVEVRLTQPNLRLAEQLANPSYGIPAPGTRAGSGSDASSTPTGTGPYRFASYAPGSHLVVQANPDYWGGRPRLSSITFRFSSDAEVSRLLAVRQVDAAGLVPHHALARVSGRSDRPAVSRPARSAHLLLNVGGGGRWALLKEDDLRRAIALALDRRRVTEAGWPDYAEPSSTIVPPTILREVLREQRAPRTNPAEARRLLDRRGWRPGPDGIRARDGRRLALTLLLGRPAEQHAAAREIVRQLNDVGIAVELVDLGPDPAPALGRVNEATYDLFFDLRHQEDANPCALCRLFSILPGGQLTIAGSASGGPKADELFERSFLVASPDAVRGLAGQLMSVVAEERVVAVPLSALRSAWLVTPRVQRFDPAAPPGAQRWEEVWLSL